MDSLQTKAGCFDPDIKSDDQARVERENLVEERVQFVDGAKRKTGQISVIESFDKSARETGGGGAEL